VYLSGVEDSRRVSILKLDDGGPVRLDDEVVVEEPLEIRVNHHSLGITMRTPGHDFDLAVGMLYTEGLIRSIHEIGTIAYCATEEDLDLRNVASVSLVDSSREFQSTRAGWANSGCGICGATAIDTICGAVKSLRSAFTIPLEVLCDLPERLRGAQANFTRTGGIHAAGLFDATGRLRVLREDIGRHNAVDKAVGAAVRSGIDTAELILLVSGRLGFEIAQKSVMAGIPVVASVSAPSSLAIELARECGTTTVGFLRGRSMNLYTHPERITDAFSKPVA